MEFNVSINSTKVIFLMTKIKKLISGYIIYSCCLWFPVSASAVVTLEAVLEEIGISEVDLIAAGFREQAEEIICSENERARDEEARILAMMPECHKAHTTYCTQVQVPLTPIITPEKALKNTWINARTRAVREIRKLLN
jgi:hypothetical protein